MENNYNDELQKVNELCEKISVENTKMQSTIASLRNDFEKLKGSVADKIPKAVLAELEGKINNHTKAIDTSTKKLFEVQNNLNTFVQQPMSHTLIDTIRKQLTEEIMANTKALIDSQTEKTHKIIEDKILENRNLINNAKKFMFR